MSSPDSHSAAEAVASKPKRSLFKRPAWSRDDSGGADETKDVFSRSTESYKEILADKERRRKQDEARLKEEEKAKHGHKRHSSTEVKGEKRRRISEDKDDGDIYRSPTPRADNGEAVAVKSPSERSQPGTLSPRTQRDSPGKKTSTSPSKSKPTGEAVVIELESDPEEITVIAAQTKSKPTTSVAQDEDSDEEFAQLAAAARARRRKREREAELDKQQSNGAHGSPDTPDISAPDPIIQLLITSPIEGTNPLIVHRKLSQRLQEIRQVWCSRQGFNELEIADVFLTFKMRRVYDVTTCKSLGVSVDATGNLIGTSGSGIFDEGGDDDVKRIHLEAFTPDLFEQVKAERKLAAERGATVDGEDDLPVGASMSEPPEPAPSSIRVVLRAKGYKDFKLKVKPDTTFAKMKMAFQREYKLADSAEVFLVFEGDRLDGEGLMKDSDIGDLDCIDVHVRA